MRYVIGVDIGTSGTKTVLFDEKGNAVASYLVEYPLYQPKIGWAEQDPEDCLPPPAGYPGDSRRSPLPRRRHGDHP